MRTGFAAGVEPVDDSILSELAVFGQIFADVVVVDVAVVNLLKTKKCMT